MRDNIIAGIDIGTSNIRIIVAQTREGEKRLKILGVGQTPSTGMKKGVVSDIEETVACLGRAKEIAERISGHSIDRAYVSINGTHINYRPTRGVIAVSRADGEISAEDIDRTVGAASAVCLLPNREILHILPRQFIVDNQDRIKDPVGMSGIRLEVDALLVDGFTPYIKNLNKCFNLAGIEVEGLILASLAGSQAVLTKRQKELGVLFLDVGTSTTGLTVFEEGDIIHTQVLPVGSGHITNDIAIGLRLPIEIAEKIKIEYGSAVPEEISKKELIDLSKIDGAGEGTASRQYVAEIIKDRANEIFDLVSLELKKIDRQGLLPAGVVIIGGGSKLPGIVDFAKEKLGLPAQVGFPIELEGIIDQADDPAFATSIGLTFWGLEQKEKDSKNSLSRISQNKLLHNLIRWFKGFLP